MNTWKILSAFALAALLCGCSRDAAAPTQPTKVESITMVVDENSLRQLETDYPDLTRANLTGSECYQAIEDYIARNPQVDVTYRVRLGAVGASPEARTLTLGSADYDYTLLLENLSHLPHLQAVSFSDGMLTDTQIEELTLRYPDVAFSFRFSFCGIPCDTETETLNLSSCDAGQVLDHVHLLRYLPNLSSIELMNAEDASPFTLEQAAALQKALPDVQLDFSFDLFGKRVTTADSQISYANQYIGNKDGALDTLRQALTVLRRCDRFVLDNCHFANEDLAQVRDEFRGQTKVVWRVWFGKGGCLTDRTVIRHVYNLYDYNSENLIYCEDAEFLDFGHNELLKQCNFVSGMPNLRAAIFSGSMISDLTPFENCKNLEFLELAYCGYVTNLSPLSACESLQRLNIAYTKADSLAALDGLPLQVLVDCRSKVSTDECAHFDSLHPECITQHTGDAKDDNPYNYPWRYEHNGEANEYYALLKEKFGYPNPSDTLY